jgi:hypothetical protein
MAAANAHSTQTLMRREIGQATACSMIMGIIEKSRREAGDTVAKQSVTIDSLPQNEPGP